MDIKKRPPPDSGEDPVSDSEWNHLDESRRKRPVLPQDNCMSP